MLKSLALFLCCLLLCTACSHIKTVKVGDTSIQIVKKTTHNRKETHKTIIHIHENETTALKAAQYYLARHSATLITLHHQGTRNIQFKLNGIRYEFDPNRIFTDRGIRLTLQQYGHYSQAAHQEVKRFAAILLQTIPPGKVIAVHNNKTYSLKDYFPKHALAKDAGALQYWPRSNYRNFYFVTQQQAFARLKHLHFNVALQSKRATNDGSLSYYFAKRHYMNIEAGYDQLQAQLKMLDHA